MKHVNDKVRPERSTRSQLVSAALAGLFFLLMSVSPSFAHTPANAEAIPEAEVQLSAYEAKRLARAYLCHAGYCSRVGPGAAKLRSITRDAGTWILNVRLSDTGTTFNRQHVIYIDANTGVVSEVPGAQAPTNVAAQ